MRRATMGIRRLLRRPLSSSSHEQTLDATESGLTKYNGVRSRNQSGQAFLPGVAGSNVGLVEKGVEAALDKGCDEHLCERQILARIRDEDLGITACRGGNGGRR